MRDNLVFTNVPENQTSRSDGRKFEDTEHVLSKFISDKLQINDVSFERVHRIAPARSNSHARTDPRPIVAKFTLFKDRERVRRASHLLRGTRFGINEQFPEEIEQTRRKLYPVMRQLRRDNERVVLVKDNLIVNGREVRPEDVPRLVRQQDPTRPARQNPDQPSDNPSAPRNPEQSSDSMDTRL